MTQVPYLRVNITGIRAAAGTACATITSVIQREIQSGALPAGGRLPPVRVLAHQLGVSKNTVQSAYDELAARDLIEARNRRGVFVKAEQGTSPRPPSCRRPATPDLIKGYGQWAPDRISNAIHLGKVFIDPELLPQEQLSACFRSVLQSPGLKSFYDAQGYRPLRTAIAKRLVARGIPAEADEVIITTGSQQALDLTCRALASKKIATENPAYGIGKMLFEMNDMTVTSLPVNPFCELPLDEWTQRIATQRPSLLYLTTNFQNPTGYSYSTSELMHIADLSATYSFGIIEDDWGSDMLSFSEYRPPLRALCGGYILYMNSFTKKLLPSMRIGYLVADRAMIPTLVNAKRAATLANPLLEEMALFEFLDRGYYDSHLKKLQAELDQRYHACLRQLEATMPEGVHWARPGGGPLIWLELPEHIALAGLTSKLEERGVVIADTRDRFFGAPHLHGFPIGYAFNNAEKLAKGLAILAETLHELI